MRCITVVVQYSCQGGFPREINALAVRARRIPSVFADGNTPYQLPDAPPPLLEPPLLELELLPELRDELPEDPPE